MAMADGPQEAPALHNPAASLSSPAPKQPSPAVEAAAPAGVAEGEEAGAPPPLPGASVLPADDGAGGAAASDEAAADEAVMTVPMPASVGRHPALHNPEPPPRLQRWRCRRRQRR